MTKADLIIHPIRMRMIIALSERKLTPKQLAAELKDVAPATLYHHLNLLTEAGITTVVEERLVRGTLHEKVYTLSENAAILSQEQIAGASKDELEHYFLIFVTKLISDHARYLEHTKANFYADGGYRQHPFYLSDEEFVQFVRALSTAVAPWLKNEPAPDRRRRMLTTMIISDPASEQPEDADN